MKNIKRVKNVQNIKNIFRSFATPPEPVQIVSECVAMLRGIKDISWKGAKGMMSDPAFLRQLQEMNCDKITLKQQQTVKAHLKKTTKLDQMQHISKAGYGLYRFVLAVLDYCAVFREVRHLNFNVLSERDKFL